MGGGVYVGIFEGHFDPAVAVVADGRVLAFAEEERFVRFKHANRIYPSRALSFCLEAAGVGPQDVAALCLNWNLDAYDDGTMAAFFETLGRDYEVDPATRGWQRSMLANFGREGMARRHTMPWRDLYGSVPLPPLRFLPHHYVHALQAYLQSPFDEALTITIDGSGDQHCTVLWRCDGETIAPLREFTMPHSLGWVYAAFTEYLGFKAYDGEYKVMGLAAYGKPNEEFRAKLAKVLMPDDDGVGYRVDPGFIHYGPRSWSDRFTDRLPELFGRPRRLPDEPIEDWHHDLAFAVQEALEETVIRLVRWGMKELGTRNLCIGGGVGLNVKMNSRLATLDEVGEAFAHPLCSDGPAAAGAALGICWQDTGIRPERLRTLAVGNEVPDETIEQTLVRCGLPYTRPDDIVAATVRELTGGAVVGWFQGRMEAGPRALGQRSILADPRRVEARDRVNAVIKYREPWRPFCPSMTAEAAARYLVAPIDAPFMVTAFEATEALRNDAPAIVHVDNSVRVQMVHADTHPLFHRLIASFGAATGVPVLLNTSFNVKGEPIVCDIQDAIRTFSATGMDVLAAGPFMLRKADMKLAGKAAE